MYIVTWDINVKIWREGGRWHILLTLTITVTDP
jgi:hypothetical protein